MYPLPCCRLLDRSKTVRAKALTLLLRLAQASLQPPSTTATATGKQARSRHDRFAAGEEKDAGAKGCRHAVQLVLGECFAAVCCLTAAQAGSLLYDATAQQVSDMQGMPSAFGMTLWASHHCSILLIVSKQGRMCGQPCMYATAL